MKKSFMTRVLAVTMSAAMAFSLSSANMVTASAASTASLNTTFKTLQVGKHFNYKLYLKKNTANWKITKVKTSNKSICTIGVKGKTSTAVYLKAKGEGSATITVSLKTSKRKTNNTKTLKCKVKVKPAAATNPSETKLSASAAAADTTSVKVTFTQAVDADSVTKDSFKFADETINVEEAVLSADGKTADLKLNGLAYDKAYEMTVTGVKVGGKAQDDLKVTFRTPEATDLYPRTLTAKDPILKSDGATQTIVTFKVTDKDGNPLKEKVEVKFDASLGKFAENRVTVKSDGTAVNMYTSEALSKTQQATITATIVESDNKELLGLETKTSITLTPNPESLVDTSVGAIITSAEAETADRVIAYFNKEVKAVDFQTASGYLDTAKFAANIYSGLDNSFNTGTPGAVKHNVVGVMDVEGENALQLLLDQPMTDNSNVSVQFEDKRNTASKVTAVNTVQFKLTDARQPSVLNVDNDGQQKIVVTFSEAVLPDILAKNAAKQFAADLNTNYRIDGKALSLPEYNVQNTGGAGGVDSEPSNSNKAVLLSEREEGTDNATNAAGNITVGKFTKGKDGRSQVTITLGDGCYLPAGWHSLQISNVGDWAANSDLERNIVNTQTFDFQVEADTNKPSFTVEEQSPEQYVVEFNSSVKPVSATDTLRTGTGDSVDTPSVMKLQVKSGNNWVDVSDAKGTSGDGKNPIHITRVKGTNKYTVEVTKDWTDAHDTANSKKTYYNYEYRLHIDKDKLYNTSNNLKNDELNVYLDGTVMRNPDNVSPTITSVEQETRENGTLTNYYRVTMDEPVKLNASANHEGLTPSQRQAAGNGVPTPLAQFQKADNSETINATIDLNQFIDAYHTTYRVKPDSELSAGEWRLVVRSISDDIDNTAATAIGKVIVDKAVVNTNFKVVWAAVSTDQNYANITGGYGSYIFVKFNKPVSTTGGMANALATSNYTLGGAPLPQGTEIRANIMGYDEHDNVIDSITIVLPQKSATQMEYTINGSDSVLNISNAITVNGGTETLSNGGEIKIPFQYAQFGDGKFANQTQTGDAVWGNAPSEQLGGTNGPKDAAAYYKALVDALNNEQYRKVVLSASVNLDSADCNEVGTLTINRPVDIDLNGHTITGNVVVSSTVAVDQMSITSANNAAASITGSKKNVEKSYSLTVNTPYVKEFNIGNGVTIGKVGSQKYATNINGIWGNTFHNEGTIQGVNITASNTAGFDNKGTISGDIAIETSAMVNLSGNYNGANMTGDINVNGATNLNIQKDTNLNGVVVNVTKAATVTLPAGMTSATTAPTIVAKDVKVTVSGNADAVADVTNPANNKVQAEGKGTVVVKDSAGKDDEKANATDNPSVAQENLKTVAEAVSKAALTVSGSAAVDDKLGVAEIVKANAAGKNLDVTISVSSNEYLTVKNNELVVMKEYTAKEATTKEITITFTDKNSSAKVEQKVTVTFQAHS